MAGSNRMHLCRIKKYRGAMAERDFQVPSRVIESDEALKGLFFHIDQFEERIDRADSHVHCRSLHHDGELAGAVDARGHSANPQEVLLLRALAGDQPGGLDSTARTLGN